MAGYTEHTVWHVKVDGDIFIEAASQEEAIAEGRAQLIAGEGSLSSSATLVQVYIGPDEQ